MHGDKHEHFCTSWKYTFVNSKYRSVVQDTRGYGLFFCQNNFVVEFSAGYSMVLLKNRGCSCGSTSLYLSFRKMTCGADTELVPQKFSNIGCVQDDNKGRRRSISNVEVTVMAPGFEDLRHDLEEDKAVGT